MASTLEQDKTTISQLLAAINSQGQTFVEFGSNDSRLETLESINRLTRLLETPADFVQQLGFAEPARNAAVRIAIDLHIFETLQASQQSKPSAPSVTVSEIAETTKASSALLSRLLKHLAATHIIAETGVDSYAATTLSNALAQTGHSEGVKYTYDIATPSFAAMPSYFRDNATASSFYTNPWDISNGPFQYAHKTEKPFFLYLNERPESLKAFNHYMTSFREGKAGWTDVYPVEERLIANPEDSSNARPILVDVGGGLGHDLRSLHQKVPNLKPDQLILQDRPEVISAISASSPEKLPFTPSAHDFFTPQSADHSNAHAYFLHSVLHDWDDDSCVRILTQLRDAMTVGKESSKLLICEYVVPNEGAKWPITSMDWLMMALGAVRERTEAQFEELLRQAGLKVTGVWIGDQGTEGVIEAAVA
ncbi:S-adenosyl-L-methionine-dependent methyltransferase [Polychaeton citri CBS 116435]|uniref:S-adenosyl-L-methionine-dependent methyltransferase n=1 Tax=Polychaeton citri CBS 116435 TaxID=1314669 RepID=A0A9P4Q635_9PEZI|nr:S-adenosyl-L-methionine-dependent methyltransferase [Polychaeton citri CBS 116435]